MIGALHERDTEVLGLLSATPRQEGKLHCPMSLQLLQTYAS